MRTTGRSGIFYSPQEQVEIVAAYRRIPTTPEGWVSATKLAESHDSVSEPTIFKIIEELGVVGRLMRTEQGRLVIHYSPEQQARVVAEISKIITSLAPEGWLTATGILKTYGIHARTTKRIANDLGVEGSIRRNSKHQEVTYYLPADINKIVRAAEFEALANKNLEPAPQDYLNMADLERLSGSSETTLQKYMEELELQQTMYKNSRGHATSYWSPEQARLLMDHLNATLAPVAPDDFLSMRGASLELGISEQALKRICTDMDIKPHKYSHPTMRVPGNFLSPDQVVQIRGHELVATPSAPSGYMHRQDIASDIGISRETVKKYAQTLGLEPHRFKANRRVTDYYSPAQIMQIRNYSQRI